jgi:hypothetical protein
MSLRAVTENGFSRRSASAGPGFRQQGEEEWWIRGDAGCAPRLKRLAATGQLCGIVRKDYPKTREVDEVPNPKGAASISREIGCVSGGGRPWGASGRVSVKARSAKHVRGRGEVIRSAGHRRQEASEGKNPKGAPTLDFWLNPRAGGSGSVWCAPNPGRAGAVSERIVFKTRREAARRELRTAPCGEQRLEGRTPGAGPGWNKPGRLRGEQSVERVRNPEGAT